MTRKLIPLISYVIGLIILLILYPRYNTSSQDFFQIIPFLIFWLANLSIIVCFIIALTNFLKKRIFSGFVHLFIGTSIYFLHKKIVFIDYNLFVYLSFILVLIVFFILYRSEKKYKNLISVILLTNSITVLLSDQFFLSYFNSTKIPWSQSGLKWEDYKDSFLNNQNERYFDSQHNKIDPSIIRAITVNAIKYKINTKGSIPSVVVGAYFVPNESYVKEEHRTSSQLNHERGYIDICEYYTRLIRKVFRNKSTGMINYKLLFKKHGIYFFEGTKTDVDRAENFIERIIEKKEEMNERYMLETESGANSGQQKKWDMKIQKLLSELDDYK